MTQISTLHYLSIDPGKTTGWVEAYTLADTPVQLVQVSDIQDDATNVHIRLQKWFDWTKDLGATRNSRLILMEAFISISHDFYVDANYSCQLIGAVRAWAAQHFIEVVMLQPGQRKSISNWVMQRSGYWRSGGKDDKREATRHLLRYLIDDASHRPTQLAVHARD